MKSISKHMTRSLVLTAALLAGCSQPALNEPSETMVAPEAQTQAQTKNEAVQIGEAYKTTISSLKDRPAILAAFKTIETHRDENNRDLIELTEIPAPPFGEETRAKRVAEMFREAGLTDVMIDAVGNVIGMRPGRSGEKTIAIGGHIDTVFPIETDVTVRREGDTYIAPGIGDNSRGVIVMLSLIKALKAHNIETEHDLMFVGNIGEEGLGDLRGIKHLYRDGAPTIDTFIAVDGGNSIPFESWMEVDMRSGNVAKLDEMDAVFKQAMVDGLAAENAARTRGDEITVDVKKVGDRPVANGDANSPLVQQALAAIESFGLNPQLRISSTDANIPISKGLPAITISRGGKSTGAHSFEETWTDQDAHIAIQIALLITLAQAGYVAP